MRILVTGAAGNLGSFTTKHLIEKGYEVVATDRQLRKTLPWPVDLVNLEDFAACKRLAERMDAVVHLGNIPNPYAAIDQEGYRTNTSANFNVFQAAREEGVGKIIFASSVQVYGMEQCRRGVEDRLPVHFPFDRDTPINPQNWYSLSKAAGEQALEYFASQHGLSAVSLRFPMLLWPEDPRPKAAYRRFRHLWRVLAMEEGARLIEHCLRADLPGHRAYFPVYPGTVFGWTPREIITELFPDVPLRQPLDQIKSLVDITHITAETGWIPTPPAFLEEPAPTPAPLPAPVKQCAAA
jgi:nucleoside-diphosphate-sugar epimerase